MLNLVCWSRRTSVPDIAFILCLLLPYMATAQATGLRVGVCDPGFAPFVSRVARANTTTFVGYDIDQWNSLTALMRFGAASAGQMQVLQLLDAAEFVTIDNYFTGGLMDKLSAAEVDIAFCSIYIAPERIDKFDFTMPYLSSGLQAVVKAEPIQISGWTVLKAAFRAPDPWATFAFILLMGLSIIFAHVIWLLERDANINVHSSYGPGVFDAWWLCLVTALTVGYGDKVAVTLPGRTISILWMFVATYCASLFAAALASSFFEEGIEVRSAMTSIKSVEDLQHWKVGVLFPKAKETIEHFIPDAELRITNYDDMFKAYDALDKGDVDVVVDDALSAQYMSSHFYADKLFPVGEVFDSQRIAIAVSRPNNQDHPVLPFLQAALMDYMTGDADVLFEDNVKRWFLGLTITGDGVGIAMAEVNYDSFIEEALARWNKIYSWVLSAGCVVWVAVVLWHNRQELRAARVRASIKKAMGLHSKFSREDVSKGAARLFKEMDTDGSGTVDLREISQLLSGVSKDLDLNAVTQAVKDIRSRRGERGLAAPQESAMKTMFGLRGGDSTNSMPGAGRSNSQVGLTGSFDLDEEDFAMLISQLVLGELDHDSETKMHGPAKRLHLQQATLDFKHKLSLLERRVDYHVMLLEAAVDPGQRPSAEEMCKRYGSLGKGMFAAQEGVLPFQVDEMNALTEENEGEENGTKAGQAHSGNENGNGVEAKAGRGRGSGSKGGVMAWFSRRASNKVADGSTG